MKCVFIKLQRKDVPVLGLRHSPYLAIIITHLTVNFSYTQVVTPLASKAILFSKGQKGAKIIN